MHKEPGRLRVGDPVSKGPDDCLSVR